MKTGRRFATKLRDEEVKRLYKQYVKKLGTLATYMPKDYFYQKLQEVTGLSVRTLSHILNHC